MWDYLLRGLREATWSVGSSFALSCGALGILAAEEALQTRWEVNRLSPVFVRVPRPDMSRSQPVLRILRTVNVSISLLPHM